ncbi:SDR family NAD(P)-dependent oxidoreductase [Janthinobacterium agaricidamnosum]|uniref:NADP-dependent 3-hydroxy acid dehydrogenase YdfG n=1 Tax=Janthinobacterium agaricidamnosum NBRC 102515 = DSM 9628 TaxID=1349767 RepID=W0VDX9_9BURK|nr:SDR family oxidoreductase [Janthinobacterium agaricidamnosum]CDG85598.1 short chain dehydrogenase family protein [Janthinobacterium agaricidamnosum NBRC 102515 = DSM 9628]
MTTTANQGTALITGASTGIGAVYADRLAHRGYDLILVARSLDKLDALAATLAAKTGRKIRTVKADLSDHADLRAVEHILREDASITALVNNAGLGATASLIDSSVADLDNLINVNVFALTRLTRAVAPGLVARGTGTIINISSIAALAPDLLNGTYGGAKAYVLALTQSLHHELGSKGVQVQAVLPGATGTRFWDIAGFPASNFPAGMLMTPENLVDSALAALDQGEVVTIPSLPDVEDWNRMETARLALRPNLSRTNPAARYQLA